MDDGRMAMAAIQRDHIGSSEEYPASDINYPFNPESGSGSGCPAGYYRSGGQCVPISSGDNPNTSDEHLDPITGEVIDGAPPTPNNGNGEGHVGGGDNFNLTPSWSRIVANTSGRSLVLMWSDVKAVNGKAQGGRALFEAEEKKIDGGPITRRIGPTTTRGGAVLASRIGIKKAASVLSPSPTAHTPRSVAHTPTSHGASLTCSRAGWCMAIRSSNRLTASAPPHPSEM